MTTIVARMVTNMKYVINIKRKPSIIKEGKEKKTFICMENFFFDLIRNVEKICDIKYEKFPDYYIFLVRLYIEYFM